MRILGLDFGERRIGVAVSDEFGWTAQGVEVIWRTGIKKDIARLQQIIAERQVEKIVIGMPRRTDGTYGPEAERVKHFVAKLAGEIAMPIEYWDERFSTVAANRALLEGDVSRKKRRQVVDKVAAVLILQGYLDQD